MNAKQDIVFKRCGCTDADTGRQLAAHCPHLADPGHGSWYYAVQVTTVGGRKARYRRGGFATREAAAAARQAIIDGPADQAAAGAWTVSRWRATGWPRPSRTCAQVKPIATFLEHYTAWQDHNSQDRDPAGAESPAAAATTPAPASGPGQRPPPQARVPAPPARTRHRPAIAAYRTGTDTPVTGAELGVSRAGALGPFHRAKDAQIPILRHQVGEINLPGLPDFRCAHSS